MADDVDPALIASANALLLSGTHLSQPGTLDACRRAIALARASSTRIVLDIDYRPVLWGLTSPGLGEQRYVASERVSAVLQGIVADCDLLVGTEEEIRIAGGSGDTLAALRRLRELTRGDARGQARADGLRRLRRRDPRRHRGRPARARAFRSRCSTSSAPATPSWPASCAAGSKSSRSPTAAPTPTPAAPWSSRATAARRRCRAGPSCSHFLAHGSPERALRRDAALEHLHRATTRLTDWPELAVFAFDHRIQLEELAGSGADAGARIARFKALLADGARRGAESARRAGSAAAFGAILDDRYGEDTLPTLTGIGAWIARPVELPGSRPLAFEVGPDLALALRAWPTEHVAKCLVSYHPDDPAELRAAQLAQLQALQLACIGTDRELLVEVIPPREAGLAADTLARALVQIYAAGVRPDWWKLPPPETQARMGADRRRDRAPRSALPRRPPARPRGERGGAGGELRHRRAARPLQGLRRRPLDLRRSGGGLVRRNDAATTRSSPTSPRATRGWQRSGAGPAAAPAAPSSPLPLATKDTA